MSTLVAWAWFVFALFVLILAVASVEKNDEPERDIYSCENSKLIIDELGHYVCLPSELDFGGAGRPEAG